MKHFKIEEFECPCCGRAEMSEAFLEKLDVIRERVGIPMRVVSGFRCARYNERIGGARRSKHMTGNAADVHVFSSNHRMRMVEEGVGLGIGRFGIGVTFLHIDDADGKHMWTY